MEEGKRGRREEGKDGRTTVNAKQSEIRSRKKQRLDTLLVDRELVESREQAKRLILVGEVVVQGESSPKPGQLVPVDVPIRVKERLRYVGRGGLKLERALQVFAIDVSGKVAIDVGASTGGFTDCLLQHGAELVYAVDVGSNQLAWQLRKDPRVKSIEQTNIRSSDAAIFENPLEIAVIDVSFISLQIVLPIVLQLIVPTGDVIALIKPQFEAGRKQVGKGGVVRQPRIHVEVITNLIRFAQEPGTAVMGLTHSPIRGPAGNIEYFLWLKRGSESPAVDWGKLVVQVVEQAHGEV